MAACDYCEIVNECTELLEDDVIVSSILAACIYDTLTEYQEVLANRDKNWSQEQKDVCDVQHAHCAKFIQDCNVPCELVLDNYKTTT